MGGGWLILLDAFLTCDHGVYGFLLGSQDTHRCTTGGRVAQLYHNDKWYQGTISSNHARLILQFALFTFVTRLQMYSAIAFSGRNLLTAANHSGFCLLYVFHCLP